MTAPRRVLPGTVYLVTRRCSERRFFLRPSPATNDIFGYILAVAANRYGIQVHAFCVLSNHFHLVVTDPGARLPEFHRYLDGLVARAVNCSLGRWEAFWDPDSYSAVPLESDAAVFEKLVYVLANPVAAKLVRAAHEWPGLWSAPDRIGGEALTFARPIGFFREDGPMPAIARLELRAPPGFEGDPAFVSKVLDALQSCERAAADQVARDGSSFVGASRVLAQRPTARPASVEPRRGLIPQASSRNKWKRIEALMRLTDFRRTYRDALIAWRGGLRDVLFPSGTWHMRVHHAACCACPA